MYHINSKTDKPDIEYMRSTVQGLMNKGIRLGDYSNMLKYYNDLKSQIADEIREKYNISNPNSSQQITYYIRSLSDRVDLSQKNDILDICYDQYTKKWTSNKEALEKLADLGYTFAADMLDYRRAKKISESITSLSNFKDSNGLVHPEVTLAKTNRINYSNPGLMTIPKKLLWNLIVAYTPGNYLYSVDIKNQEPSILINMTNAEELKEALTNKDGLYETLFRKCFKPTAYANVLIDTLMEDRIYAQDELEALGTVSPVKFMPIKPEVAETYFGDKRVIGIETICIGSSKGKRPELPDNIMIETEDGKLHSLSVEWNTNVIDKYINRSSDYTVDGDIKGIEIRISKVSRKEFKTSWIAISYGASKQGIQSICKNIDGSKVYDFATKVEQLKNYRSLIAKHAKAGNQVVNTIFGTPINAGGEYNTKRLQRVLLDLPIQGTGADILSLLIKHFYEYVNANNLSGKLNIYYTRHDELIIEVDKDFRETNGADGVESILRDIIEHQIDNWTPFQVEVNEVKAEKLDIDYIYTED